ncbi:MAG: hypothetical protein ACRDCG_00085 [Mycoplasmoidaceae bacterium]
MAVFKLEIFSPLGEFYNKDVISASFYSGVGQVTILAHHCNITGIIEKSAIVVEKKIIGYVKNGVYTFYNNNLKIVTSSISDKLNIENEDSSNIRDSLLTNVKKDVASDSLIEIDLMRNLKSSK